VGEGSENSNFFFLSLFALCAKEKRPPQSARARLLNPLDQSCGDPFCVRALPRVRTGAAVERGGRGKKHSKGLAPRGSQVRQGREGSSLTIGNARATVAAAAATGELQRGKARPKAARREKFATSQSPLSVALTHTHTLRGKNHLLSALRKG